MTDRGVEVAVVVPTGLDPKTGVEYKDEVEPYIDLTIGCLAYYEELFGIDFPLKKLDLIALHSMFV